MAGMFAAWLRRIFIAFVAVAGCMALFVLASAVVKAEPLVASWYGPGFEGNTTASGEPFDPYDYTAAHRTYEFGTRLIVTYEGRSVVVRVNDRGPYVAGRDLDLSRGAAEYIGLTSVGVATVNVEIADPGAPTGPYGGTKKVRREAPAAQPEEPADNTVQQPAGSEQAETNQQEEARQDFVGIGEDQYASEEQYEDVIVVEQAVPPAPPAPQPAVPVLPPEPEPAALESPPEELAVPNSTIVRRVELNVAATPAQVPEQPVETASAEPVAQEAPEVPEPVAQEAPAVAREVSEAPELVPVAEDAPEAEETPETEKPTGPGGITVLPDTGGGPLGTLVGGALLLGAGVVVRAVRR